MSLDKVHIEDPTMKVKAPTSMLNALGNTYVNLNLARGGLDRLYIVLGGELENLDEVAFAQPTSVLGYVKACQELSWKIEGTRKLIEEHVGGFEWSDDGHLVRLT